jgi:hypothetical protein
MLGWMRSPAMEAGGDLMVVGAFLKSKASAIAKIALDDGGQVHE